MQELKELGLTEYESRIYEVLLKRKTASAKTISEESKVPITAVYPNLSNLLAKGLIQKVQGETKVFQIINPKLALEGYTKEKQKQLEVIKENALEKIKNLPRENTTEQKEVVSLTQGVENSMIITDRFIDTAKKSFYIIGWRFGNSKRINKFIRDMGVLKKRKIDIKIIFTTRTQYAEEVAKECKKMKIQTKYYPIENFSLVIKDMEQCKITLKSITLKERLNILLKDKDLSNALSDYFLTIWEKAEHF